MGKADILLPAQAAGKYSKEDLEHAADSSREMIQQSRILQTCVATMIAARRIYMIARSAMDNEVIHGWNCDDQELILQTLVMSSQERANTPFTAAELHRQVLGTVLPFVDIVAQQEKDTGDSICPAQPESEENPDDGTDSQTEQELGGESSGDQGDAGEAGRTQHGEGETEARARRDSGGEAG